MFHNFYDPELQQKNHKDKNIERKDGARKNSLWEKQEKKWQWKQKGTWKEMASPTKQSTSKTFLHTSEVLILEILMHKLPMSCPFKEAANTPNLRRTNLFAW